MVIEAGNPDSQARFTAPAVTQDQFVTTPDEKKVDGIEAAVSLPIRAASHGLLKLGESAGFRVGQLTGTADP